jgi:hypothetical protein
VWVCVRVRVVVVGARYSGNDGKFAISSLDAPVVSCGLLTPFPTPGDNTTLAANMANGMHWNVQNNIWNTNYPQWYPFEGVYGHVNDFPLNFGSIFRRTLLRQLCQIALSSLEGLRSAMIW